MALNLFKNVGKSEVTTKQQIESRTTRRPISPDNGAFLTTEQGLAVLTTKPADAPKWRTALYLKKEAPLDPWGKAYIYKA